ncbi:MAG: hypothetical protein ACRD2D_13770 [Terriglobales bacterium]
MRFRFRSTALLGLGLALTLGLPRAQAQDPGSSSDRPAGNVNELTLAGLRPGASSIAEAITRLGSHWRHPSADEQDIYIWCDARTGLQLQIEAPADQHIEVVTIESAPGSPAASRCKARLPATLARTGRGVRLGATPAQLKKAYGTPFFQGPSSWHGRDAELIVFNFSWAGSNKPQILESTFEHGHLAKMTLSAQYY